jgi:hypothetical protein
MGASVTSSLEKSGRATLGPLPVRTDTRVGVGHARRDSSPVLPRV